MQVIKEIKIAYFRSFSKQIHIKNINDLNVFSGKNDSGKSNILKALNLFFTESKVDFYNDFQFERDFSKHRINESKTQKQKQLLSISILFNKVNYNSKVLPSEFWVEKSWNRDGNFHERKTKRKNGALLKYVRDGESKESDTEVKSSTTSFLNKIHFLYIPAIKESRFFDYLKQEYQQSLGIQISKLTASLESDETKTLREWTKQLTAGDITNLLSRKIDSEAERMMLHFLGNTKEIESSNFSIPDLDFSKVLEVVTENDISLTSRGDGIQAKFIPQILNEITRNKKASIIIWAFEEPENSYEYANAQLLAEKFRDEYSKDKQIFLTSHAFNFISLEGKNVSLYRVWRKNLEDGTHVEHISSSTLTDSNTSETLQEELGVIGLNKELEQLFKEKIKAMNDIKILQKKLEDEIKKVNKPILYVEDEYDEIYKISWLKSYDIDCDINNFEELFNKYCPFSVLKAEGAGSLQGFLQARNIDYWRDKKVIGLFDFDETGSEKFKLIKKNWGKKQEIQGDTNTGYFIQRDSSLKFFCLLIPIPERLTTLASLDFPSFVEIEHLLQENFLTENSYAVKKTITGNTEILKIHSDKKNELWKKLFCLNKDDFKDFVPLYQKVNELFELL